MNDRFNVINLTMVTIGILLLIAGYNGDTPMYWLGRLFGRTDIPKGTLLSGTTTLSAAGSTIVDTTTDATKMAIKQGAGTAGTAKPPVTSV